MAKPSSRTELAEYALRALGKPVIKINVDPTQIEDRLDEAIQYWQEFHADASEEVYIAHQVTAEDITNEYFTLSDEILWVENMLPVGSSTSTGIFDLRYQIKLNDPFTFRAAGGMTGYYITKRHINMIEHLLGGEKRIQFSRYKNRLTVDADWSETFTAGDYIMVHGWQIIDPEEYGDAFNDILLKELVTALIKRQWGQNLSKYENIQLPGGITLNGSEMKREAEEEITRIKERAEKTWQAPLGFLVG